MAKKIAASAECAYMGVAPHNPAGPFFGELALNFEIATPNFVIQEEMAAAVPWFHDVVSTPTRMVDRYWQLLS